MSNMNKELKQTLITTLQNLLLGIWYIYLLFCIGIGTIVFVELVFGYSLVITPR